MLIKKENVSAGIFVCLPMLLLLATRPSLDVGFVLVPSYFLLIFLFYHLFSGSTIRVLAHEKALIIFHALAVLTSIYSPNHLYSLRFAFGVAVFWLIFLVVKFNFSKFDIRQLRPAITATGIFYLILCSILYVTGLFLSSVWVEHGIYYGVFVERGMPRLVGLQHDPNIAAITLMPFVFYFAITEKRYLWATLAVLLLTATLSRGAMLALVCGYLGYIFIKPRKQSIVLLAAAALVILAALWVVDFVGVISFQSLIDSRFSNFSSGSGRVDLWRNGIDLFLMRPLMGWGAFSFRELNLIYSDDQRYAHNTYLEVLVETGLIGLSVFLLFVIL